MKYDIINHNIIERKNKMMIFILIIFALTILPILFNKRAVPVFLYHQVNPISSSVSPEIFEEHLKIIKKYNPPIFLFLIMYYNIRVKRVTGWSIFWEE